MKNCVLTLGYFDSLHIGHRFLIQKSREIADELNASVTVVTFEDGFLNLINRKNEEVYLLNERTPMLLNMGVNDVCVFPATKEFLSISKETFLEHLITLKPKAIVLGSDYTFAKNADGKASDIKEFFEKIGTKVYIYDLIKKDNEKVSTTKIKELLKNGEIEKANFLLGDTFFYSGRVVKGRQKGKEIGIPTININIPECKIKIKNGVYRTTVTVDGETYRSITNIGKHPTFGDDNFNVETNIFDFNGNLYGKNVTVKIYEFIRGIINFKTEDELRNQIKDDIQKCKRNI